MLSGTLSDASGVFTKAPASLMFTASQAGGPGLSISASFINTTTAGAIPETSTWAMMALGFAGIAFAGYRGSRTMVRRSPRNAPPSLSLCKTPSILGSVTQRRLRLSKSTSRQ
jgi:hypothetical protein